MTSGVIHGHLHLASAKAIPELTLEEFRLFQALVLRESGIHLGEKTVLWWSADYGKGFMR